MTLVFVAYLGKTIFADSSFRDVIVRTWLRLVSIRRHRILDSASSAD